MSFRIRVVYYILETKGCVRNTQGPIQKKKKKKEKQKKKKKKRRVKIHFGPYILGCFQFGHYILKSFVLILNFLISFGFDPYCHLNNKIDNVTDLKMT